MLARHGARDPTSHKSPLYNTTITDIQSRITSYGPGFEFLKTYKYTLGAAQLTDFGRQEMVNSGRKFYSRYQDLARNSTPFIRSSGANRVVESADYWMRGFHEARLDDKPLFKDGDVDYPYKILVIPEIIGKNNSLWHGLCASFEVEAEEQKVWADIFIPPITTRLNENLPGANLDRKETLIMMDLCPFNTVASPIGTLSPFCNLFTLEEWYDYDYYQSLGKYYGYGAGNPLGATQGVGFANELISRLTNAPVRDGTSTNRTLDSSPLTFPLNTTVLYADLSHDNDITGMFAALGLYNETKPLSSKTRQDTGDSFGYSASWTVPFGSRAYFEKLSCSDGKLEESEAQTQEYIRVIVNDRVLPLHTCGADEFGRCNLENFVDSLSFAEEGGHWDQCFLDGTTMSEKRLAVLAQEE
jgi:hypothetical protein